MLDGQWNRCLGWTLLLVAFAAAAWLDPWSLAERDPAALPGSPRMMIRHAQAVVIGMAFLQLVVADVLAVGAVAAPVRAAVSLLSALGTLMYAAGYGLMVAAPGFGWLAVAGAASNFLAFTGLTAAVGRNGSIALRVILPVFCFGMLLDVVMGLFATDPVRFLPDYLGAEDGLRLRMLRLARAAVIALPLLAFLFHSLASRVQATGFIARWGQVLLLVGAAAMPLTLVAAAFTSLELKYLLPLPAQAALWGTVAGLWLAKPPAHRLERAGWLLVVGSMAAGLTMGLYAFDGPAPSPGFLGEYNDFGRRLSRLGHAYCIVLGLACILLARDLDRRGRETPALSWGVAVLTAGAILTVLGTAVEAAFPGPVALLGVGPAVVAAGLLLCRPPWPA